MVASRVLVVAVLCIASCSSSPEAPRAVDAASPVARTAVSPDLSVTISANASNPIVERIVQGAFTSGLEGSTLFPKCAREEVEGCRVLRCPKGDAAIVPTPLDPGTVTVSSSSFGMNVVLPPPNANGIVRVVQPGNLDPGEAVRVVGTGSAAVAPFDLTIRMPPRFGNVALGACTQSTADEPCVVSDPEPILSWTGGGEGFVTLSLTESTATELRAGLGCTYPAKALRGRVPAAALAKLPRKSPYWFTLGAQMESVTSTEGAGAKVRLRAERFEGENADGSKLREVTLPAP